MDLSTGDLSNIEGCMLLMTATASATTLRLLQNQFPEIRKWQNLLNPPLRDNVTLVIPPPKILSSSPDVLLAPFIADMNSGRVYLVIVRGKYCVHLCSCCLPKKKYPVISKML